MLKSITSFIRPNGQERPRPLDDLEECLLRIEQASELILEAGQVLHDDPKYHRVVTRLSFLTTVIDEATELARKHVAERF